MLLSQKRRIVLVPRIRRTAGNKPGIRLSAGLRTGIAAEQRVVLKTAEAH